MTGVELNSTTIEPTEQKDTYVVTNKDFLLIKSITKLTESIDKLRRTLLK